MRYKLLLNLTLLLLLSYQVYAQDIPDLIPFRKDGKWGYMDKNRKVIIPAKFQQAELFEDGYAFVRVNDKRGTIDKKGNYIISPDHALEYDMPFLEGLIAAKDPKSGLTGYMDKKGQWQIKPQFNRGFHFSNGVTAVVIDEGKNWVFINKQGKVLSKPRVFIRGSDFYFGMHVFEARSANSPTGWGHGLLNRYGQEVLPAKYFQVHIMNANLIHIHDGKNSGFVDSTGEEILPLKYTLNDTQNGYSSISLDKKTGVIDSTGKFVIPLKYERFLLVGDGKALVVDSVTKGINPDIFGHFVNMKGEALTATHKINGKPERCSGSICVASDLKFDINNPNYDFRPEFFLINLKGERVSTDVFSNVGFFKEGMVLVLDKANKAGFVDATGKLVIKCQYEFDIENGYHSIPLFKNGLCMVSKGGKTFYIDKAGKEYRLD